MINTQLSGPCNLAQTPGGLRGLGRRRKRRLVSVGRQWRGRLFVGQYRRQQPARLWTGWRWRRWRWKRHRLRIRIVLFRPIQQSKRNSRAKSERFCCVGPAEGQWSTVRHGDPGHHCQRLPRNFLSYLELYSADKFQLFLGAAVWILRGYVFFII